MARILHLISQIEQGGAQRQLAYVVANQKWDLEIASLIASPKEKLFPFFQHTEVPIHFLSNSNDFYAPEILPSLIKLVRDREYSLIFCWLFQSIVQGLVAARAVQIPCIASPRNMLEHLKRGSFRKWEKLLIRRALWNADRILFPSYSVAMDFIDSGWAQTARSRIIQNGVDTDYFGLSGKEGNAIVTIGRDAPEKGLEDFESIATNLRTDFATVPFCVAGGKKAQGSPVELLGHVEDVRPVLERAMIFLNTSIFEGMSNAVLEAQSMGIPVVAKRLGSTSEIVEDGITGLLADNIQDLTSACRKLLNDADLRKEMGRRARERMISRFQIAAQTKKIEALYSELL